MVVSGGAVGVGTVPVTGTGVDGVAVPVGFSVEEGGWDCVGALTVREVGVTEAVAGVDSIMGSVLGLVVVRCVVVVVTGVLVGGVVTREEVEAGRVWVAGVVDGGCVAVWVLVCGPSVNAEYVVAPLVSLPVPLVVVGSVLCRVCSPVVVSSGRGVSVCSVFPVTGVSSVQCGVAESVETAVSVPLLSSFSGAAIWLSPPLTFSALLSPASCHPLVQFTCVLSAVPHPVLLWGPCYRLMWVL